MNDFTKQELEDIRICINAVRESSSISEMNYGALYEKLQSMIDNYCEHEEIKVDEERPHMKFTCMKCNKIIFGM